MANDYKTLADLILVNDQNLADRQISDLLDDAPLLAALPADIASNGTQHKYTKETGAPTVGFRVPNAGRDNSKSVDELVTTDCKLLDASFAVDQGIADAFTKGGPVAYVGIEAVRHLRAAFFKLEQQFYYGDTAQGDASGFKGLANELSALSDDRVKSGGGTTADTGSSVWAIRATAELNDVVAIAGEGGAIRIGQTTSQRIKEEGSDKTYPGYYTPIQAWHTLQIGGKWSVARLANLTEDAAGLLNDDKLMRLREVFPAMRQPTWYVMTRRSRRQLQESRTATNATGAPAPLPTESDGIPIIVSDGVLNTEPLLT